MGRPTKLTAEVEQAIVDSIERGNFVETACAVAGIHKDSFYEWMKVAEAKPNGVYGRFRDRVRKALAKAESNAVSSITAAGGMQWQALAWRLERMHPHWRLATKLEGRIETDHTGTVRNEITGPDGGPVKVTLSDDAILGKLLPELVGRGAASSAGAAVGGGTGTPADPVEVLGATGATDPAG